MYNHGKYHLRAILKHLWYKLQFSLVIEDLISHTGDANGKESICQCRRHKRHRFDPWVGKIPWRRAWQPTTVFLPGESHGQRILEGYSPWGHKESDMTERLTLHFQLKTNSSKSYLHPVNHTGAPVPLSLPAPSPC